MAGRQLAARSWVPTTVLAPLVECGSGHDEDPVQLFRCRVACRE